LLPYTCNVLIENWVLCDLSRRSFLFHRAWCFPPAWYLYSSLTLSLRGLLTYSCCPFVLLSDNDLCFFFLNKFLLEYIHDMGGFIVTILIKLISYIIYIASVVSPPQPRPDPT
jgi:hypothetical protein